MGIRRQPSNQAAHTQLVASMSTTAFILLSTGSGLSGLCEAFTLLPMIERLPRPHSRRNQRFFGTSLQHPTSALHLFAPPGSGYMSVDDEESELPDSYEPMMEYPGTMRPGKTPENMPFHDLPIGDDDPEPIPWPHFQQIEWHHKWEPPHPHPTPIEDYIEQLGRWATPEMEAAIRAGARRGVKERREAAESEKRSTLIMDDEDDDEAEASAADLPVELGDGVYGTLGSVAEEAATAAAVKPPSPDDAIVDDGLDTPDAGVVVEAEEDDEEEEEEEDSFDDFLLDLGLDIDDDDEDDDDDEPDSSQASAAQGLLEAIQNVDDDSEDDSPDDEDSDLDLDLDLGFLDDVGDVPVSPAATSVDEEVDEELDLDDDDDDDDEEEIIDGGVQMVPLDALDDDTDTLDNEDDFDDGGFDYDDGDVDTDGGDVW